MNSGAGLLCALACFWLASSVAKASAGTGVSAQAQVHARLGVRPEASAHKRIGAHYASTRRSAFAQAGDDFFQSVNYMSQGQLKVGHEPLF